MTNTLTINGTGKVATVDVKIKDDEVTVVGMTIYSNGTSTEYRKSHCLKHEWLLYKFVKNYLYDIA